MRRTLLAGVAVAMLAAPSAHAHPTYHYTGGCSYSPAGDGANGPQSSWTGLMSLGVGATDVATGAPAPVDISAGCDLYVNGVLLGTYLTASGIGMVVAATEATYQADLADIVTLCEFVAVGGAWHYECANLSPTSTAVWPPAPPPVVGPLSFGAGCGGGWTDAELCVFNAPAGAFAASGYGQQYTGPISTASHVTMRVYVLVGTTTVTLGTCSSTQPGGAWCTVTVQATPYPGQPHFCEVTGAGNYGWFGCGDPPPLKVE